MPTDAKGGYLALFNNRENPANTFFPPTVGVEFDTYKNAEWDPADTNCHIGVNVNSIRSIEYTALPDGIFNGIMTASVRYDAKAATLSATLQFIDPPGQSTYMVSANVDLRDTGLPQDAAIGFSASIADFIEQHQILSWSFESTMTGMWIHPTSDSKINKTPNKMAITGGIRKRITISRTKLNIKLHRSINRALIPKSRTSKKILNVLFLRDRKAIRSGGNLNAKKIAKRTKISHKKLISKTILDKVNILGIITSNDHIINIEKKKSASTRTSVNEKCWIMKTRRETSSCHHRGEALKPGTRGLFETIERTSKTTNHPIGNRIPRRRLHVNLLTQLAIKKSVLNIKLGHRPASNRSNIKKGTHSGHMSHRGKSLIIVTAVLLLKATSHKTRFIALKRSIRASLNFIDPLTRDRTNTRRGRNKIPSASALKRSDLLSHGKLPFRMTLGIPIRSRLGNDRETILTRRVTGWSTTLTNMP
ncbi:hypothetical protein QYE76_033626 [Lolium multiflorum]|uniref:Legume lectin domain-containing protein n=1 Tax=Lolium multiflorum TaxID=4521 RepID=A0AAD8QVT6_LOLMU|nr:hypothetical protein QYE76_033626 [Lolium multiflorum]